MPFRSRPWPTARGARACALLLVVALVGKLMTGPQVDEFAKRHPAAQVVDVIVHRAACAVWMKAFRAATVENSTHEQRQAARAAGDAAVAAAGYRLS